MMASGVLSWRRLAGEDLPMLARWLAEPRIARWWNHETSPEAVERDFGPSVRGEEPGENFVVLLNGTAIGLVQRARFADYPEDFAELAALIDVPPQAVEIDYLIGDPALRGRGLGPRLIAMALARTWIDLPEVPAVIVPVVAANRASWRALETAGLTRVAEGPLTPDNPIDEPLHFVYRIDRPRNHNPKRSGLIWPGFRGVGFLESSAVEEDSDAPQDPAGSAASGTRAGSFRHEGRAAGRGVRRQ